MAEHSGQATGAQDLYFRYQWEVYCVDSKLPINIRKQARVNGGTLALGSFVGGESTSQLLQNINYSVACGIEIYNKTRFELTEPWWHERWGRLTSPPVTIGPGNKEVMVSHKVGYTPTGCAGIASWLINNNEKRVFVLWSIPFFTSNVLAIGLTDGNQTHDNSWYDMILDQKNTRGIMHHTLQEYNNSCGEIQVADEDFKVLGSMGSSSKPVIKIILKQQNI